MGSDFHNEKFDLESVLLRAKKTKGKELTPKEIAKFEKLCAEYKRAEKKIEELQTKEDDAETKRLKDLAEIVLQQEVKKAQQEPKSEERTRAILAERAEIKKKLRKLGYYDVSEEANDNSDSLEEILPYYIWLESWLQTNADAPSIEESLDCYIKQYSLLSTNQEDKSMKIAKMRLKCEILEVALENVESLHWETINDHLRKSQRFLILFEEQAALWRHSDQASVLPHRNETNNEAYETELTDEDLIEVNKINAELNEIEQQMRVGTIDSKVAIARIDELEYRLGQIGNEYSRVSSRLWKYFRNLFRRFTS